MINTERIVPVSATDLLTLYGTMMKLAGTTVSDIQASDPGVFTMTSGSGNKLAAEPVQSFDFAAEVTSATIYFIPAYNYAGFSIAGVPEEPQEGSATVVPDGKTLYAATLSSGDITIAKVGF